MGKFGGDLEILGIANLLQAVTANQREGRLTVAREGESKTLLCGPKGLRLLEGSRRVSPLGEILVRTRKLTRSQLDRILADHGQSGLPLGEYVAKRGLVSRESIDKALMEQVADEIYDLFTWTQGTFEYVEPVAEPAGDGLLSTVVLDHSIMFIALEAARRMDDLARIREVIPGERLVPVALEIPLSGNDPGLDRDSLQEILPFIDGRRSVAQIIEESLYPKFTVLLTLYAMAQRGSAKIRDVGASDGPETVLLRKFAGPPHPLNPDSATIALMADDAKVRLPLSLFLGNLGFAVVECPARENLTRLLTKSRVGLVLLDIDLAATEGLDRCRTLSAESPAPLIVMTSLASDRTVAHAFGSGARHVLVKPVSTDLLLERVKESLVPQSTASSDGR